MRNKGCNGRATARVAPTEGYKECLAGGRTGASAPTEGVLMVPCAAGHMGPALHSIFVGQGPRALPGMRENPGRADVGIGPYGSVTRGAMGGRPQGSPLRKPYKECLAGGRTGASAPTGGVLMVPYAAGHMSPALQGRFCRAGPACPAGGAVQGRRVGFIECVLSS